MRADYRGARRALHLSLPPAILRTMIRSDVHPEVIPCVFESFSLQRCCS